MIVSAQDMKGEGADLVEEGLEVVVEDSEADVDHGVDVQKDSTHQELDHHQEEHTIDHMKVVSKNIMRMVSLLGTFPLMLLKRI